METRAYTIHQAATLARVSVRTLHHYDQIGLLRPKERSQAGYRLYRHPDLLRLQQILFYRELDVPLEDIRRILDQPGFDPLDALEDHRRMLQARQERLTRLLHTIDKTIHHLKEDTMPLTDEELYEGLTPEQRERYDREAQEMYDPQIMVESARRLRKLTKAQWQAVKEEGGAITLQIANLMDRTPSDPQVQQAVAHHYAHLDHFYSPTPEIYRGLAEHYVSHPEFHAFYEKVKPGLAEFMQQAMLYYVEHTLKG
jgi:DNA-binding transcriptional MerR regulator